MQTFTDLLFFLSLFWFSWLIVCDQGRNIRKTFFSLFSLPEIAAIYFNGFMIGTQTRDKFVQFKIQVQNILNVNCAKTFFCR
jgi:hypothetical protein